MISYFKFLSVSLSISFLLSEWHASWKQLFEDVFLDSILCERTKVTLNFPLGLKIMFENSNTKSLTCFCFKIILGPCFLTSCAGAEVHCLKCSYFYWKVQKYCACELFICERTNIISPSFSLGWSVIIIKEQTVSLESSITEHCQKTLFGQITFGLKHPWAREGRFFFLLAPPCLSAQLHAVVLQYLKISSSDWLDQPFSSKWALTMKQIWPWL